MRIYNTKMSDDASSKKQDRKTMRNIIVIAAVALVIIGTVITVLLWEEQDNDAPDRNQVRVWYDQTFGNKFANYMFADFTDIWEYSDGSDSLILINTIDVSYDDCIQAGESNFEKLFSEMKSNAKRIGSRARGEFKYNRLAVRIHLISSDDNLLCTVSESGYRTDDNAPPIWGYK